MLSTSTGDITEYSVPTASSAPNSITTGPDGNMWFTEASSGNIGVFVLPSSKIIEYPVPTASSTPYIIVNGPDSNLWFTEPKAVIIR
jgi:virginiamycin B lyase